MRSASSAALRSASAKSTGAAAFFAPNPPSFDFFGAADAELVIEEAEEFKRDAPSLEAGFEDPSEEVEFERRDAELTVLGALPTLAALPITGGDVGLDDAAGEGDLTVGLSHDEKKSSSAFAAAGVPAESAPSTTTFSGDLGLLSYHDSGKAVGSTHLAVSSFTRRASSSLYSSATRLEYFFLQSESLRSAEPPCLLKKSVADALPPTFIVRSWFSCQLSRFVDLQSLLVSDDSS